LLWFSDRGFPTGELGRIMMLALTLKETGLEDLVKPLERS